MNIKPAFDGALLMQAIQAEEAAMLQMQADSRLPINKANKARLERRVRQKEALIEFAGFCLERTGVWSQK